MTAIDNLVSLHDGRPGIRALMQVEVRSPGLGVSSPDGSDGIDGKNGAEGGEAILDFVASTGMVDPSSPGGYDAASASHRAVGRRVRHLVPGGGISS